MTRQFLSFPGVPFPAHAPKYVVPALSLRQLRSSKEMIGEFLALEKALVLSPSETQLFRALDITLKLVHLAITRNYPEATEAEIEDLLDMNTFRDLVGCVMGSSGFKLVTQMPEGVAGAHAGELTPGS